MSAGLLYKTVLYKFYGNISGYFIFHLHRKRTQAMEVARLLEGLCSVCETMSSNPQHSLMSTVAHSCFPSTQEVEARVSASVEQQVQYQCELHETLSQSGVGGRNL